MKKLETQVFVGNTVTNTAKTELITVRTSLSSIQQEARLHMSLVVGGTLNPKSSNQQLRKKKGC